MLKSTKSKSRVDKTTRGSQNGLLCWAIALGLEARHVLHLATLIDTPAPRDGPFDLPSAVAAAAVQIREEKLNKHGSGSQFAAFCTSC